jgi:hypothetical protein
MSGEVFIELYDELTEEGVEVTIETKCYVEPTEYEGGCLFYPGGASLEEAKASPYVFQNVTYSGDIPAHLLPNVVFEHAFEQKQKEEIAKIVAALAGSEKEAALQEASKLITEYVNYLFEEHVVPKIQVPVRNYPRTM